MNKNMLRESDENTSQITLEFLEDGYVLKNGSSAVHRYELDVIVRNDITLDQLLVAVYAGIHDTLKNRFNFDVTKDPGQIYYERTDTPFEERRNGSRKEGYRLRPKVGRELLLRASAMRYNAKRRKINDMERRYPTKGQPYTADMSPEERERMGWIVCWQVFRECYSAYTVGYPDHHGEPTGAQTRDDAFLSHPIIMRSTVNMTAEYVREQNADTNPVQLWLEKEPHGDQTLRELGFVTSTRLIFDPVMWSQASSRFDERVLAVPLQDEAPLYNIGRRHTVQTDMQRIRIDPPRPYPVRERPDLIHVALIPLVIIGMIVAVMAVSHVPVTMVTGVLLILVMVASTLAIYWMLLRISNSSYDQRREVWRSTYERYIRSTVKEIIRRQNHDREELQRCYAPALDKRTDDDLLHRAIRINGDIFSRRKHHTDYLAVRVGTAAPGSKLVESLFPVDGEIQDADFSAIGYQNISWENHARFRLLFPEQMKSNGNADGSLERLPADIAKEYQWLSNAPVLMHLGKHRTAGLVIQDRRMGFDAMLANMLLDLCFHHGPEQVQIVMLCRQTTDWKERQDLIYRYKHLPHFRRLLQMHSAFAFTKEEAWRIFDQIWGYLQQGDGNEKPHILVIAAEEYDLRKHKLGTLLPASASEMDDDRGITFLFCKHDEQELPPYCAVTAVCDRRHHWYLFPYRDQQEQTEVQRNADIRRQYAFCPDTVADAPRVNRESRSFDVYYRAFSALSALYYRKNCYLEVPAYCDLFHLLAKHAVIPERDLLFQPQQLKRSISRINAVLENYVAAQWKRAGGGIPYGRTCSSVHCLDLSAEADGAHLLVAGDPGSGKTNFLLSYLVMLCAHRTPQQAAIMLVSLHRSELISTLTPLPHMRQIVTDADFTLSSISERIRELIRQLDQELVARQLDLDKMGVGNLWDYNKAVAELDYYIRTKLRLDPVRDAQQIASLKKLEPMPELYVVIDDFDKLQMYAQELGCGIDLTGYLMRIIQQATELGVHIIVTASRMRHLMHGQLLDLLPARIGLKCRDHAALEFMDTCDSMLNGQMPGNGRAWMCSMQKNYTDYVQICHCAGDLADFRHVPYQVTLVPAGGAYIPLFDSQGGRKRLVMEGDSELPHGDERYSQASAESFRQTETAAGRHTRGDRRYEADTKTEAGKKQERRTNQEQDAYDADALEQLFEDPDAVLHSSMKTGITQGEALVSAIVRYHRKWYKDREQSD